MSRASNDDDLADLSPGQTFQADLHPRITSSVDVPLYIVMAWPHRTAKETSRLNVSKKFSDRSSTAETSTRKRRATSLLPPNWPIANITVLHGQLTFFHTGTRNRKKRVACMLLSQPSILHPRVVFRDRPSLLHFCPVFHPHVRITNSHFLVSLSFFLNTVTL
jgi:hypothetical protein